jgi:hypothetical protein
MVFFPLQRWISFYVPFIATTFNSNILWYSYSPSPSSARISAGGLTSLQSAHSSHEWKRYLLSEKLNIITLPNLITDFVSEFSYKITETVLAKEDIFSTLVRALLIFSVQKIYFTDHETIPAYEGEGACLALRRRFLAREENTVLLFVQETHSYTIKTSSTSRSM